jgi:hypothetical protein
VRRELDSTKLPIDLKLLFENKYIECIQLLIILFVNKGKRKGVEILEISYYFTLLNSTNKTGEDEYHIEDKYLQNSYLSSDKKVRDILLVLANQGLVNIRTESGSKRSSLYVMISDKGKDLIGSLENIYFEDEISKANYLIKFKKYSTKSEKGVLMGDEN